MMKRIVLWLSMLLFPFAAYGQTAPFQGFCQNGGVKAVTSGLNSTNTLQGSYPNCTVTVYLTGTTTKATIYADSSNTPLSNPFTATTAGSWLFYAGVDVDVTMSGGVPMAFPYPVTLTNPPGGGTLTSSILYVGPGGYSTVQAAVAAVTSTMNHILIAPGNYSIPQQLTFNNNIPVDFECGNKDTTVLTWTNTAINTGLELNGGGHHIHNCTLRGPGVGTTGEGSAINSGYNAWAANTSYSNIYTIVPTVPNANGFWYRETIASCTSNTTEPTWPAAEGSTVTDGSCIWAWGGITQEVIENNIFDNWGNANSTSGGGATLTTGGNNYGWIIRGNKFQNAVQPTPPLTPTSTVNEAVFIAHGSQRNLIEGNEFVNYPANAIDINGARNAVTDNQCNYVGLPGGAQDRGCVLLWSDGSVGGDSQENVVKGNHATNIGGGAFIVKSNFNGNSSRNVFIDNTCDVASGTSSNGDCFDADGGAGTLDSNSFIGNIAINSQRDGYNINAGQFGGTASNTTLIGNYSYNAGTNDLVLYDTVGTVAKGNHLLTNGKEIDNQEAPGSNYQLEGTACSQILTATAVSSWTGTVMSLTLTSITGTIGVGNYVFGVAGIAAGTTVSSISGSTLGISVDTLGTESGMELYFYTFSSTCPSDIQWNTTNFLSSVQIHGALTTYNDVNFDGHVIANEGIELQSGGGIALTGDGSGNTILRPSATGESIELQAQTTGLIEAAFLPSGNSGVGTFSPTATWEVAGTSLTTGLATFNGGINVIASADYNLAGQPALFTDGTNAEVRAPTSGGSFTIQSFSGASLLSASPTGNVVIGNGSITLYLCSGGTFDGLFASASAKCTGGSGTATRLSLQ